MGKGSSGVSSDVSQGELANSTALTQIAQSQAKNATQLYNTSFPGFQKAEDFYSSLSSGDPYAIARAISPAAQQIDQASDQAKANILRTGPTGGEKNLALEQVDVNRGAQVGSTASSGYTGSFNALAQLAGQGISASTSAASTGISGYNASSSTLGQVGQQQIQAQQIQAQEKGSTLGAIGSLGGGLLEGAGAAGSFGALFA